MNVAVAFCPDTCRHNVKLDRSSSYLPYRRAHSGRRGVNLCLPLQVCSEGLIYVRVTATGKASTLQQIVRLVEQAQVGAVGLVLFASFPHQHRQQQLVPYPNLGELAASDAESQ